MAKTQTFIAKDLPKRVTSKTGGGRVVIDGLPPFVVGPLHGQVAEVIGAFMYGFSDGSVAPCFIVKLPGGNLHEISMDRCRVVEPKEFGEWERTGKLETS